MFSMHDFILTGMLDAVGKMPDYWVIFNAAGWQEKGVLTQVDLQKIQQTLELNNIPASIEDGNLEKGEEMV